MTPLPSLKLSVRRFEGVGLTGGQSQVEPPCALGCEWVLGCWRQASEQPSVSPGGSASAGVGCTGSQESMGMWAYAFRAPLGAFNFCEKPIFT